MVSVIDRGNMSTRRKTPTTYTKSLKISNRYSETVNQRGNGNTMAKKRKNPNNNLQNTTGGKLVCPRKVSSSGPLGAPVL